MGLSLFMVWTRKSTGLISIELVDLAMNSSEISCTIVLPLARFCFVLIHAGDDFNHKRLGHLIIFRLSTSTC